MQGERGHGGACSATPRAATDAIHRNNSARGALTPGILETVVSKIDQLQKLSVIFIAVVLLFAVLNIAGDIFVPVIVAMTAGVVLSPISDAWDRMGVPTVYAALTSLFITVLVIGGVLLLIYPIIGQLVDQAPRVWTDIQDVVSMFRGMMDGLSEITEEVSSAVVPEANAQVVAEAPADAEVDMPTVGDAIMLAPAIAAQFLIFVGTLFFFLMTRRQIYDWIASKLAAPTERAGTARRLREAERQVSTYFLTVTAINAGLGAATAAALQVMGVPGALLWGLLAGVLNFVPYLGPTAIIVSLLFAGIAAYDGAMAIAPAAAFATLNAIEAQFVTPTLVGRQLRVNPLLVFLALVLGIWLWGPLGGLVAIPMLLWVLVLADVLPKSDKTEAARKAA